jgi:hypothetical protein
MNLARNDKLIGERAYLESLFIQVPTEKRKQWLSRLASVDRGQFWGAWFEMMLFGWLKPLGDVVVEVGDNEPDFILDTHSRIAIEARTILTPKQEWLDDMLLGRVFVLFRELKQPFVVKVLECSAVQKEYFDGVRFSQEVSKWLDDEPDKNFSFDDKYLNHLTLSATFNSDLVSVYGVRHSGLKQGSKDN